VKSDSHCTEQFRDTFHLLTPKLLASNEPSTNMLFDALQQTENIYASKVKEAPTE